MTNTVSTSSSIAQETINSVLSVHQMIVARFAAIYLKRSSDKVWKDLKQFEHRAMYGPKCDIVMLRYEMWDYKGCFHWGHTEYLKSIWKITDARQRYEI